MCFFIVLLVATGLRLWDLEQNGFGNIYYAATIRSMASGWHNFLYASFDPAGFLSVDKPPIAFWLQVLSVRLLGYSGFSLHLPQAIEGILAVALVYYLTRRVAGEWGALVAALVMAVSPASIAADRSNLADSCLVLTLLLAAWAVLRATETGRLRWFLLAVTLVGVGFNVKLLAAYIVLPTFYLLYWVAAPLDRKKRLAQVSVATVTLLVVSWSWPLVVDLTPEDARPYVGDTPDNSAISLGLGRRSFRPVGRAHLPPAGRSRVVAEPPPHDTPPDPQAARITGHGGRPGLFRLANRDMAGHISWWIPFTGIGLVAFALVGRPHWPFSRMHHAVLLWCGWLVTHAVVFSFANAPVHPYYLSGLAPALAVLVGVTSVHLRRAFERGGFWLCLPAAAIVLTAFWQAQILRSYPNWRQWLLPALAAGTVASVSGMLLARALANRFNVVSRAGIGSMTIGLAVLLVCPALWAATPVLAPGGRMVPIADPSLLDHRPRATADTWAAARSLVEFLRANREDEQFLMAVPDVHLAAPIIIETGEAVMAYGGFTGQDPILTAEEFAAMVEAGQVRFVMLSEPGPLGSMFPRQQPEIETWVRRHGKEVPSDLWRTAGKPADDRDDQPFAPWGPTSGMIRRMFSGPEARLYDCRTTPESKELVGDR